MILVLFLLACGSTPAEEVPASDLEHEDLTCQHGSHAERWVDHKYKVVCYRMHKQMQCVPVDLP